MCERNIDWLPLECPQLGTWTHNPGMCPDWELNWRPFDSQVGALSGVLSHTSQGYCTFFPLRM